MADPVVGPIEVRPVDAGPAAYKPMQRCGAVLSDGTLIQFFAGSDTDYNPNVYFHYSDDDGATWTHCTNGGLSYNPDVGYDSPGSFVIDEDDVLWVSTANTGTGRLYRGVFSSGTITWDPPYTYRAARTDGMDLCAFKVGADTYIPIIHIETGSQNAALIIVKRTAAGTFSNFANWDVSYKPYIRRVMIDWNHTGDGVTPNGDPDFWYLVGSIEPGDNELEVGRGVYSSGPSWVSGGSPKLEDGASGDVDHPSLWWDGTRLMVSNTHGTDFRLWEMAYDFSSNILHDTSVSSSGVDWFTDPFGNAWGIWWDSSNMRIAKWDRKTETFESSEILFDHLIYPATIPWVVANYPIVGYSEPTDASWQFISPVKYPSVPGGGFGAFGL